MSNGGTIHCCGYGSVLSCLSSGAKPNVGSELLAEAGAQRTLYQSVPGLDGVRLRILLPRRAAEREVEAVALERKRNRRRLHAIGRSCFWYKRYHAFLRRPGGSP